MAARMNRVDPGSVYERTRLAMVATVGGLTGGYALPEADLLEQ